MKIKREGLINRLKYLFELSKEYFGDDFIILSDSFIVFFEIGDEDLKIFNKNFREYRIELMKKYLDNGKIFEDDDMLLGSVFEFGALLLSSFHYYNKSIYLKAYHLLGFILLNEQDSFELATLSPYVFSSEIEIKKLPGYD